MMLARAAERSLDVQYYIWRGDMTGMMLLEALHEAADRGVRVRLLLDDNGTSGLDRELAALDGHPNIEVRLYNPFAALAQDAGLPDRLQPAQPAHAQQVLHRRQPGHHHRRPQRRR